MTPQLQNPDELYSAFVEAESDVRRSLRTIDDGSDVPSPAGLLEASALLLELLLGAGCLFEVMDGEAKPRHLDRRLFDEVKRRCGIDLLEVGLAAARKFGPFERAPTSMTKARLLRDAKSILESCPIEGLEHLAAMTREDVLGHRCRRAFDDLRSFVRRNDPRFSERLGLVGRKYAEGVLSIEDVGLILRLSTADAVAALELHGFQRRIEVIRLSHDERTARFGRMRADRLARNGEPIFDPSFVDRDVVASERIEGVDARPWMMNSGH
ncbi:MAG: hypothetical protein IT352_03945 [Gemmatimonadales bacterium]|nr:hypothetical protein [Gemmatimonadales bacterium]